jgi:hypothetical protein
MVYCICVVTRLKRTTLKAYTHLQLCNFTYPIALDVHALEKQISSCLITLQKSEIIFSCIL